MSVIVATRHEESDASQLDLPNNNKRRAVGHSRPLADAAATQRALIAMMRPRAQEQGDDNMSQDDGRRARATRQDMWSSCVVFVLCRLFPDTDLAGMEGFVRE